MYKKAEKDYNNGMKYKDIATKYGVSINTVKSWKTRYWGKECTPKKSMHTKKESVHTKNKKKLAKELIISGASIRETSDKVGLPKSTIGDISSKYNLQAKQLEYLKEFAKTQREIITKNKLERLRLNTSVLEAIRKEVIEAIQNGTIPKSVLEKLKLSEEIEQQILELDRIERLEKAELELEKNKKESENKTISILDKLERELGG